MQKKEPFNYQIVLKGKDFFGSWSAAGNFIMTENGPFLWFLKVYDDRQRAGQTGEWWDLLYESEIVRNDICNGRWFYDKFQDSYEYSGKWKIEPSSVNQSMERIANMML